MKHIKTLSEYINDSIESGKTESLKSMVEKELNSDCYAIEIIIENSGQCESIFEHQTYKTFKGTRNRYTYHPENNNIPVKAHYHIYPPNSKSEIYAVNIDGSAHHKKNRGYNVPSKEAKELRKLDVKLSSDNILEMKQLSEDYTSIDNFYSIFIIINNETQINS